jgi:hypothetical protein
MATLLSTAGICTLVGNLWQSFFPCRETQIFIPHTPFRLYYFAFIIVLTSIIQLFLFSSIFFFFSRSLYISPRGGGGERGRNFLYIDLIKQTTWQQIWKHWAREQNIKTFRTYVPKKKLIARPYQNINVSVHESVHLHPVPDPFEKFAVLEKKKKLRFFPQGGIQNHIGFLAMGATP